MAQLSFFSPAELAAMRDRTKARNHSPERDAFRRAQQRGRDHGKAQRHAARIYRDFQQSCDGKAPQIPDRIQKPDDFLVNNSSESGSSPSDSDLR
ncbi:hypothetical protein [Paractinoplanes rishiriensis]|uniref:Uncharacterized protein n=1 Tax=Paractinoplanes rishiriensis TaxID=1050105 RepID=A0A919MT98_9ACTN|nr:hypothetical protein [Actinoplanes rishiriensis]GIE94523.1 hypothetical protein Ari01nite_19880 [Actinoplanes rishiriensis]